MCGICGFAGFDDKGLLKRMADSIRHRGPDDEGFYTDSQVGLANRRLSIVDVAGGHMPISNEDGSVWVTYNGEIYNYQELREEISKLGHRFKTRSDTETIVHGYELLGPDFVKRLNGIFAFALWDVNKRRLVLGRDQMGVKPLHYSVQGDRIFFGSELKAILQYPGIAREIDEQALFDFLNQSFIPGERTMLLGIKKLLPAHYLVFENGVAKVIQYWRPDVSPMDSKDDEYYAMALATIFRETVKSELQGEVAQGVYLSGGVDSTSLLATMRSLSDERFHTYTVGFGEATDETKEAARVSEHFGCEHHELFVGSDALKHMPEAIWHLEEPRRNIEPTLLLSKLARKHVKVVHSGLGGDELFGGYDRSIRAYKDKHLPRMIPRPIRKIATALPALGVDKLERGAKALSAYGEDDAKYYMAFAPTGALTRREGAMMLTPALGGQAPPEEEYRSYFNDLKGLDFFDQHTIVQMRGYMAEDLLQIVDRETAACGLEGRVPFCNRRMVEFSFRIPQAVKMRSQKHVLRMAMRRLLPKEIVENRTKRVFGMSSHHWFKGELKDLARKVLTPARLSRSGYFKDTFVEKTLRAASSPKRERDYTHLWNMTAFEIWKGLYLDGDVRRPEFGLERLFP
ncbi:MAG: asparagine synthase (glutamine-hydrolyzing) [Euryarchaeota archaeon]|nr:asparagine synthase (glutamine-hydrolyzing) [Euryarchaeota archaeon]